MRRFDMSVFDPTTPFKSKGNGFFSMTNLCQGDQTRASFVIHNVADAFKFSPPRIIA
jgi:hypothetical protein